MKNLVLAFSLCLTLIVRSQVDVKLNFTSVSGSPHADISVTLTPESTEKVYNGKTDASGSVLFSLPAGTYIIVVSNSEVPKKIVVPDLNGATISQTYMYKDNEEDWNKKYPLTAAEIAKIDQRVKAMNDSTQIPHAASNNTDDLFSHFTLTIKGINDKPLINERVYLKAKKRNKVFYRTTNSLGKISVLLPKGDTYSICFKYDPDGIQEFDVGASQGSLQSTINLHYEGSVEIERRRVEEKKRLEEEERRLTRERKEFEEYCRKLSLSALEARKEEIEEYKSGKRSTKDNVLISVFDRNKHWKDKLVVCDLTGSMSPYAGQLATWYGLNYSHEQNAEFVFFNDGDNKADNEKVIGSTGGIYYTSNLSLEDLINTMSKVSANGYGGDGPENNIEALLKGLEQSNGFKELIMIADNHAPVKDIILLSKLKVPVRIILCGVNTTIHPDYLKIAYATKGSVHTIEEDILSLYKVTNGGTVIINGNKYKLMNGRFVHVREG